MSDQPAASDQSSVEWETLTSKNGVTFKIGREKAASVPVVEAKSETPAEGEDFGITVDWPVGGGWTQTTEDVKTTAAITQYNLAEVDGDTFKYTLEFSNTDTYDYKFFDQTGDSYEVNTWQNRTHYVKYNSDKPTIVYISGN
ncbi:hypothetical protein B9Z19DRAFT_1065075 [Tuber borchii]|uniref:Uncharacterized protein n=1 Tax=Tuber borchii TaxID=42251 RepID=A0A2T6ZSI2_TUBBO|nr:hypothetical protein B9Z19DRAFT_1065075 [Tuber borchii]